MHVLIQVDGGSRGNPGPAAAGVTITDAAGRPIFEAGFHLEPMTNNQAEYHGLLCALREARRLGATRLDIKADSELLVRQINGQYKVKNEGLRPLYESAVKQLRAFDSWRMVHVRREGNTRADELANLAMDAGRDVIETDGESVPDADTPPPSFEPTRTQPLVAIRCTHAPDPDACPAPCKVGWTVSIATTTAAGLCIHPAGSVFSAVCQVTPTGQAREITCPVQGCGARFSIEPDAESKTAKPRRPLKR